MPYYLSPPRFDVICLIALEHLRSTFELVARLSFIKISRDSTSKITFGFVTALLHNDGSQSRDEIDHSENGHVKVVQLLPKRHLDRI